MSWALRWFDKENIKNVRIKKIQENSDFDLSDYDFEKKI